MKNPFRFNFFLLSVEQFHTYLIQQPFLAAGFIDFFQGIQLNFQEETKTNNKTQTFVCTVWHNI